MIIDQAANSFLKGFASEIDKQPDRLLCQTKIGQQLLGMRASEALHRFDFDKQPIINHNVDPKCRIKFQAFELYINRLLALNPIPFLQQFGRKHGLINAFQQPRPQVAVNTKRDIHNVTAQHINVYHKRPPRLCASARTYKSFRRLSISSIEVTLAAFASGAERLTMGARTLPPNSTNS